MSGRLDAFFEFVRRGLIEPLGRLGAFLVAALAVPRRGPLALSLARA